MISTCQKTPRVLVMIFEPMEQSKITFKNGLPQVIVRMYSALVDMYYNFVFSLYLLHV